jgi:hypothetical protein
MRRHVALLSLALLASIPASAQQSSPPLSHARPGGPAAMAAPGMRHGPGMMGGGMMGMGGMMMAPERIEGRLAFLETELGISDAQMPAWNAFAEALRANARTATMQTMRPGADVPAPQMLELHEQRLAQRLEAVRRTAAALGPLYAALSDEQKKTADQLLGYFMM